MRDDDHFDAASAAVSVVREGVLTIVTINRPEARNALTAAMHRRLGAIFDDFESDADQWIAIVTGAGDKAFCAGSDLKEIAAGEMKPDMQWPGGYAGLVERFDLQKPLIAAVNGQAMGGGFEIALACDIVVAEEHATFGLPEPRAGVAAVGGGLHRLPRQIGYQSAMGMILTGNKVSAAEGYRLGFVNEIVKKGEAMAGARRWAETMLLNSPMALRASKDAVRRGLDEQTLADALRRQDSYPGLLAMRRSEDYREGPRAFIEKRPPVWRAR